MLPSDPMILLSFVNTRLRDEFASLDLLCKSLCVDAEEIKEKLATIDYFYDPEVNRFV